MLSLVFSRVVLWNDIFWGTPCGGWASVLLQRFGQVTQAIFREESSSSSGSPVQMQLRSAAFVTGHCESPCGACLMGVFFSQLSFFGCQLSFLTGPFFLYCSEVCEVFVLLLLFFLEIVRLASMGIQLLEILIASVLNRFSVYTMLLVAWGT